MADEASPVVPMDMPLRQLLDVFRDQNVGVLPVADQAGSRRIVGVVEQRDLLRTLQRSAVRPG
jgi:CBS-domain-containing membrane protein